MCINCKDASFCCYADLERQVYCNGGGNYSLVSGLPSTNRFVFYQGVMYFTSDTTLWSIEVSAIGSGSPTALASGYTKLWGCMLYVREKMLVISILRM